MTWMHWYNLVNMVTIIQQIQLQWDTILINSCHNCHTKIRKTCNGQISTSEELVFKVKYFKVLLRTINTTEQYHFSHAHNCTSILGCHDRHQNKN